MIKRVGVLSVLLFAAARSPAFAQSSVTLSGLIDAGVSYISNQGGHGNVKFDDGIALPNLLQFTGREDIGGGNAVIFRLEDHYVLGSGSFLPNQSLFSWQSYVGFDSREFGKLTFGNQQDFMKDALFFGGNDGGAMYTAGLYDFRAGPFTKLALPNSPTGGFDWDRLGGDQTVNNSVKYRSPDYHGLSAGMLYGFGGVPGSIGANNATSFALNYSNGGFGAAAAYTNVKSSVAGAQASVRNWGLGSHYRLGPFLTTALFTTVHNGANGGAVWAAQLGEFYQITPFWSVSAAYVYMKGNTEVNDNHAHQMSAAVSYAFSKRTVVYLSGVYQRTNEGAKALINGLTGPTAASSGPDQAIARIGLVTRF